MVFIGYICYVISVLTTYGSGELVIDSKKSPFYSMLQVTVFKENTPEY